MSSFVLYVGVSGTVIWTGEEGEGEEGEGEGEGKMEGGGDFRGDNAKYVVI